MKKYRITYKEVGKPEPGSTYYTGYKTEAQVIEFLDLTSQKLNGTKLN